MCYTTVIVDCGNGNIEDIFKKIEDTPGVKRVARNNDKEETEERIDQERIGRMIRTPVEIERTNADITIEMIRSIEGVI